jgi:hypothetical protein
MVSKGPWVAVKVNNARTYRYDSVEVHVAIWRRDGIEAKDGLRRGRG